MVRNNIKILDMKKIICVCLLAINFGLYAQEQAYGTLAECETCSIEPYLGVYKYVSFKPRFPKREGITNWISVKSDDYYYKKTILIRTDKMVWNSSKTSQGITIGQPTYTIDKYRLENRGEPYFEGNRFWRNKLSYYNSILNDYDDFSYLLSIRKTHINDGNGEYLSGDYFLEIFGDKLINSGKDNFYLLEKVDCIYDSNSLNECEDSSVYFNLSNATRRSIVGAIGSVSTTITLEFSVINSEITLEKLYYKNKVAETVEQDSNNVNIYRFQINTSLPEPTIDNPNPEPIVVKPPVSLQSGEALLECKVGDNIKYFKIENIKRIEFNPFNQE